MSRHIGALTAVIIAAFGSIPASASSETFANCQAQEPRIAIAACTEIIENRDSTLIARTAAYANRALKTDRDDLPAVVRDFTAAIELNSQIDARDRDEQLRATVRASQFHGFRGRAYYSLKDYTSAAADFDRAVALDATAAKPRFMRGVLHATLNRIDPAIADLNAAIKLNPNYAEALHYRGWIHSDLGHLQLAFNDLSKAAAIEPQNASYRSSVDEVQHKIHNQIFSLARSDIPKSGLNGGFSNAEYR